MITNFAELTSAITRLLPSSSFGEDNDGQIIIYTNKRLDESDALIEMEDN